MEIMQGAGPELCRFPGLYHLRVDVWSKCMVPGDSVGPV
jgi:hypothetical protein